MKTAFKTFCAFALFVVLAPTAALAAENQKQSASIEIGNDFYAAGNSVALAVDAEDDAFLAGAIVNVTKKVAHDLFAAGSTVTILGSIGDDLRVGGSVVSVAAPVGGDALAAGGVLNFTDATTVAGDAVLAGGMLDFAGVIGGDAQLAGGQITFSGTVTGNAKIQVDEKIDFADGAKIGGALTIFSKKEIKVPDGIAASVEFKKFDDFENFRGERFITGLVGKLFLLVAGLIAGAVLLAIFGKSSAVFAEKIRVKFWWSLLAGSVAIFVPLVAILLAITVVGAWLGGIIFAFWIAGMLVAGSLVGFALGSLFIRQKPDSKYLRRLAALALGWIIFVALGFIPGFGGILQFTIFVLTLGAGALTDFELYKKMKTAKLL